MTTLANLWLRWEAFWDEREPPWSLGLLRILLGLCFVYDFVHLGALGLVQPLFAVGEAGGLSDALMREDEAFLYRLLPGTMTTAWLHYGTLLVSSILFTIGLLTRTSTLVLLIAWAEFASVMPHADRGIDTLSRLALLILVLSPAGKVFSVDALLRTGSVWGSGEPEPSWARKLVIGQIVLMYFDAGISKTGITWWPMGHFAALYFALQDPAVAAFDYSGFIRTLPAFFVTQLGTAGTMVYQLSYPFVLVLLWWRRHPDRAGRLGRVLVEWRAELLWIGVGFLFHVILGISMNLGIFPWAMLSLYPAWITPEGWKKLLRRG